MKEQTNEEKQFKKLQELRDKGMLTETELHSLKRLEIVKQHNNGTLIGNVSNIKNVSSWSWLDFKDMTSFFGNSEGQTLTALVEYWKANPANLARLQRLRENERQGRLERINIAVDKAEKVDNDN